MSDGPDSDSRDSDFRDREFHDTADTGDQAVVGEATPGDPEPDPAVDSAATEIPSRARHAHAEQTDTPPFGIPRQDPAEGAAADAAGNRDEDEQNQPAESPAPPDATRYGQPPQQQAPQEASQYDNPSWSASQYGAPQYQYDAPQYGQQQYDAPQYGQQYDAPQYGQQQYDAPHYEAPNYQAPQQYEPPAQGSQAYAPPFQPLAPSTPPPMRQGPGAPGAPGGADQQPESYQQQQPGAQPRHYAPDQQYAPEQQSGAPQAPNQPPTQEQQPAQQRHQPQHQPQHRPVPPPRPEDLLEPNQSPVTTDPAHQGWRGRINRGTFGLVKAKAGPEEIKLRTAITGIQRSFSRPMTVVVVQPKGGAGKTPTTICLSAAFGAYRGGYVVGWDDNETRGTLAVRVANPDDKRTTVWDLLSDLAAFERFDARVGDLSYYVRAQPDAHFDALVSDDNPANMAQIGEDEFHRLHRVLQRFYRMIVVDTGNNVRSPNWQAAVNAADLVVVVSTYQRDAGYSGSWVLDHLAATGREELARNAVTVLTAADPTTDKGVRQQLIEHFSARTRAVTEIPYDPQLAHGGSIRWTDLAERTRHAWIHAGAIVVDALAEQDQQALAARRS